MDIISLPLIDTLVCSCRRHHRRLRPQSSRQFVLGTILGMLCRCLIVQELIVQTLWKERTIVLELLFSFHKRYKVK